MPVVEFKAHRLRDSEIYMCIMLCHYAGCFGGEGGALGGKSSLWSQMFGF